MNFLSIEPRLESLAPSFSISPKDSRVLAFIMHQNENPLPEDHFGTYGAIERGWFHDPIVQPFQVELQTYTPTQGRNI
ncbi:MAG TPA: hypothetical protein VMW54_00485 [Terriglobia bacterium]|nr:hypothetical protein [Terriglobia bacterium]